jgi:hypothetical protein
VERILIKEGFGASYLVSGVHAGRAFGMAFLEELVWHGTVAFLLQPSVYSLGDGILQVAVARF